MRDRSPWRIAMESLPCSYCGALPEESCRAPSGKSVPPHAARFYATPRCPVCHEMVPDGHPGALCERCALVRALELERMRRV